MSALRNLAQPRVCTHLVLSNSTFLQIRFNVSRIQVGNTHQKPRTRECPQAAETEGILQWKRKRNSGLVSLNIKQGMESEDVGKSVWRRGRETAHADGRGRKERVTHIKEDGSKGIQLVLERGGWSGKDGEGRVDQQNTQGVGRGTERKVTLKMLRKPLGPG